MKILDFIQKLNETENINLKTMLEIRTYIPIAEKRAILETMLDRYFTVEDGVPICDYVLKKIMFELAMVKYHTNLDLDITSEEDYDELQLHWDAVMDFFGEYYKDYQECEQMLEGMEQEFRAQYSVESSIARLSNKLSNSINGILGGIADKINDFDMSKFGFDGFDPEQFKDLLNKYGK